MLCKQELLQPFDSKEDYDLFMKENSWDNRVEMINQILENLKWWRQNGINEKISDKEEDHLDEVNLFRRWKKLDDYLMVVLSEDEFKWNETWTIDVLYVPKG